MTSAMIYPSSILLNHWWWCYKSCLYLPNREHCWSILRKVFGHWHWREFDYTKYTVACRQSSKPYPQSSPCRISSVRPLFRTQTSFLSIAPWRELKETVNWQPSTVAQTKARIFQHCSTLFSGGIWGWGLWSVIHSERRSLKIVEL
jgi:hypothetical protein